jgi:WD40 repeat protein
LDGDTLKLCLSLTPDQVDERPREFATRKGVMRVLVTFKRQPEVKAGEVRELTWPGGKQTVFWTAFSPDGRYLLAGGALWESTTAIWETATGKLVTTIPASAGAVFLPDSRHILGSGSDGQLVLWDPIADKEVRRFEAHRSSAWPSLSADGTRALSYGAAVGDPMVLWDVTTGKRLEEIQAGHDCLFTARLSPDGKRIVSVGLKDRIVRLWDVAQKKVIRSWESKDRAVYGMIYFCPDSRSFVIAAESGTPPGIVKFDEQANSPSWRGNMTWEGAAGLSQDGRFALLSDGKTTVRGFDLRSGREIGHVVLPTDVGSYIAVSPDGRTGAATGPRTGTIKGAVRVYLVRLSDSSPKKDRE